MRRITIRGLLARKLRLALTALAIILGVTFVTGTLVLGDTLNSTFNSLIGTAYQHVSFQIRGVSELKGGSNAAISGSDRRPIPASILPAVRKLDGVSYAWGAVQGSAQFVQRNGNAIGGGRTTTLGFGFDPNAQLSPYRLVEGRAPHGPGEVVMDRGTATKYHYRIGDTVLIDLPNSAEHFRITGIVTFGNDSNLAGITLAGFDEATAQRLFNLTGHYNTISVLSASGADTVRLQQQIEAVLPHGVQVVSGQQLVNELTSAIDNELSFISTLLLIFALIALLVGGFTIYNTFSITVGQRTRELALLRVVGASRRQLFRSVLGEAAITGFVAALIGLGMGVLAALGLKALLGAFGIDLPSSPLVFKARTPVVAIAVGVGVTVLSAIVPARRAVRIAPVAALVDPSGERPERLRGRRGIVGGVAAAIAVVAVAAGVAGAQVGLVGIGALAAMFAVAALAPAVARPLADVLGRPLALRLGVAGRLGRANAMRSPRRTAQTAAALMIGLTLVSTIAVLGASLSTSVTQSVDTAINADYIITGNGGFSRSVVSAVSHLPGVTTATTIYRGQFEFRGSLGSLTAASPQNLAETVNLQVTTGRASAAMAAGELLIDSNTARSDNLHVGSVVPVRFAQTGSTTMRIGGIFKPNPLVGSFVTGDRYFIPHFHSPQPGAVLLRTAPGSPDLNPKLNNHILVPYANVSSKTKAQFEQDEQKSINQLLGLVYVLLALAVVIAMIGIVNTLMLSVFERTREIGLLRAVGMERRQVRWMVRAESVIIAVFGAVVGIVVGPGLGLALASSLRNNNVTAVSVPVGTLVIFLVLAALLGLAAASWPARRAARLDVLRAIATE
ncbi:MAG: ABC transporter permease [Conexibacteraceae bacterium]|nr:ABC transporter permease [Conexibacteraceae bacterium]